MNPPRASITFQNNHLPAQNIPNSIKNNWKTPREESVRAEKMEKDGIGAFSHLGFIN